MDFQHRMEYNHSLRVSLPSDADSETDCSNSWASPNHALFQIAHVVMLLAYLTPNTPRGVLLLHAGLAIGKIINLASLILHI